MMMLMMTMNISMFVCTVRVSVCVCEREHMHERKLEQKVNKHFCNKDESRECSNPVNVLRQNKSSSNDITNNKQHQQIAQSVEAYKLLCSNTQKTKPIAARCSKY